MTGASGQRPAASGQRPAARMLNRKAAKYAKDLESSQSSVDYMRSGYLITAIQQSWLAEPQEK
ncbi:hypothetical protein CKO17_12480 [Marichromatium gracile]|nr:hypothetical protein [Marichromatium gracile]